MMKKILIKIEKNCISGALLLLPVLVFFVIMGKVWSFFQKYGEKAAQLFGLDEFLGVLARDVMGGLFLLVLLYLSGYVLRLAYVKRFAGWIDEKLMIFLPGYEKNKKRAEEKLNAKTKKTQTETPIMIKQGDFWQPGYLIEKQSDKAVVYIPLAPDRDQGIIYIVDAERIKYLDETSLIDLNSSIKLLGKGLLRLKAMQ